MTGDDLIRKYGIEDHIPARWPRCGTQNDEIARLRHANTELVSQRNDLIHDMHLAIRDRDLFRRRYLVAAATAMMLAAAEMLRFLVWVAR